MLCLLVGTHHQVKRAVAARDVRFRSILAVAAWVKNADMLRDDLDALEEYLTKDEVLEFGVFRDSV